MITVLPGFPFQQIFLLCDQRCSDLTQWQWQCHFVATDGGYTSPPMLVLSGIGWKQHTADSCFWHGLRRTKQQTGSYILPGGIKVLLDQIGVGLETGVKRIPVVGGFYPALVKHQLEFKGEAPPFIGLWDVRGNRIGKYAQNGTLDVSF